MLCACRSSDPAPTKPVPAPVAAAAVDAGLTPARAALWARLLEPGGLPGSEVLAYCKGRREPRELEPGIALQPWARGDEPGCELVVTAPAARREIAMLLPTQQLFPDMEQHEFILDQRDAFTVRIDFRLDRTEVAWIPYVPLEAILGHDGQLLVGLDIKRALDKPAALPAAIAAPFTISPDTCEIFTCVAESPRIPGSDRIRIDTGRALMVTIPTMPELVPRVHALITNSLGFGQQVGPHTVHVHERDGIHYDVRDVEAATIRVIITH